MENDKPAVRLEDWAVVPRQHTGEYRQLCPGNSLVGRAFGHPKMREGMFIFTSPILRLDSDESTAETRNTTYSLGEASYEYKAWAREHAGAHAA